MTTRQIELDDDTSSILDTLAASHNGDASVVVAQLLHTHDAMESMLDEWESENHAEFARQKQQSDLDFCEGRVATLDEVKRACSNKEVDRQRIPIVNRKQSNVSVILMQIVSKELRRQASHEPTQSEAAKSRNSKGITSEFYYIGASPEIPGS